MSLDPVIAWLLRASLGLLLVAAAVHKLRGLREFVRTLADYRLLPRFGVHLVAPLVPVLELGVAGALLVPGVGGPLAAAALFVGYSAAIALNLGRGRRHIDCGCGGPSRGQTLSGGLLLRNGTLVLAAGLCLLPTSTRPLVGLDAFTLVAGVGVLAALYAASDRLLAQAPALARVRSVA